MAINTVAPLNGNIQVRKPYRTEQKIYDELMTVVDNYAGVVSYVSMIGIVELVKSHVINNQGDSNEL